MTALIRAQSVINQNFTIKTTRGRDTSGSTILTSLLLPTLLSSKFYDSNQPLLRHIHNRRVLLLTHIRVVTLFCSCFVFSISKTLSLVYWFQWRHSPYITCLCNIHQQNDSKLRLRPLCSDSIIQAVYEYKSKWLMIYLHNAKSSTNKGGHTNDSSSASGVFQETKYFSDRTNFYEL